MSKNLAVKNMNELTAPQFAALRELTVSEYLERNIDVWSCKYKSL